MKSGCTVCREGLEALKKKLLSGDYDKLEDLSLCNTCRMALLKSIDAVAGGENRES